MCTFRLRNLKRMASRFSTARNVAIGLRFKSLLSGSGLPRLSIKGPYEEKGNGTRETEALTLKVAEALGKDVGRVMARLDPQDMTRIGYLI